MTLEFDRNYYLNANPDVRAAGIDAQTHYNQWGAHEGRDPNGFFDEGYYLESNPDVAAAVANGSLASGYAHYQAYGAGELRNATELFNEAYYLNNNGDVATAVHSGAFINGYTHFLAYGQTEGRGAVSTFSESTYLAANPDVAAAVHTGALSSGWTHFAQYGRGEFRSGVDTSLLEVPTGYSLVVGTDGDDYQLSNTGGNALIKGKGGNDYLIGNGDNVDIFGDAGKDTILGMAHHSTIHGGADNDIINTPRELNNIDYTGVLYGDSGKDLFVIGLSAREGEHGNYTIMDFTHGEDAIKISSAYRLDPNAGGFVNYIPNGFADVMNLIHNDASGNAVITVANNLAFTLVGIGKETLTDNDFLLPYGHAGSMASSQHELYHDELFA